MSNEIQGLTGRDRIARFRVPFFGVICSFLPAVLAVVLVTGCGGGEAAAPQDGETAEAQAEKVTPPKVPAAAEDPDDADSAGADAADDDEKERGSSAKASNTANAEPATPPQAEVPAAAPAEAVRSQVVADWTDANFEAAVRERDLRVLQAIDEKVKSAPGDAAVAKLLTQLLAVSVEMPVTQPQAAPAPAPLPGPSAGAGNGGRKRRGDIDDESGDQALNFRVPLASERAASQPGQSGAVVTPPKVLGELTYKSLTEHIIAGLIENNSGEAWQTFKGIFLEQVKTSLTEDESGSLIVFELIRRLGGANSEVPNVLGAAIDGSLPLRPAVRSRVLRIMTAVSSAAVDQMTGFPSGVVVASAPSPLPVAVQPPSVEERRNHRRDDRDDEDGGGAGMRFGGNLRVAEQSSGKAAPSGVGVSVDLDEQQLQRAAAFLWRPAILQKLFQQLQQSGDAVAVADVVSLCASVPQDSARRQLYEYFQKNQADGATKWIATGLFDANQHDPAMLVTLKALPRPRPVKARGRRGDVEQPMDSWSQASMKFVFALRDRIRDNSAKLPQYDGVPPVRLHRGATPDVSVMISLPGDQKVLSGDSAPSETKVYYTRVQYTPVSAKDQTQVAQHYEERASGERHIDQQKGLLWFDGTKVLPNGTRRTVDIIIQGSGGASSNNRDDDGGRLTGGGGGAFSIEIIVVEATNPRESAPPKTANLSE